MTHNINYDDVTDQYWIATDAEPLWFNSYLDAKDTARQMQIDAAVKAERDRIVAWLREAIGDHFADAAAEFLASGGHLK